MTTTQIIGPAASAVGVAQSGRALGWRPRDVGSNPTASSAANGPDQTHPASAEIAGAVREPVGSSTCTTKHVADEGPVAPPMCRAPSNYLEYELQRIRAALDGP